MQISYFINQYPKVSHSFIRREILALERQGFDVQRIALRGWDGDVVDIEDKRELKLTHYVLQQGVMPLLMATMRVLFTTPVSFLAGLKLAMKMGWKAERAMPYHLIYLAEACRILPWLKAHNSRHIHAHFGTNSAEVVMLAHELGGPDYSFTVHGPEEFDKPQFLGLGEKIRRSAFVVAISSFGRSQLFRWVAHSYWNKVKVVHCGLEQAFYKSWPIEVADNTRIVCVGRLCEQKGQLLLLEATKYLADKGVNFELVLAGDGEMRSDIEQLIATYHLASRVRITGWISSDQVRQEILAARALVLPSFAEGLPVVIMEAMSLCRPVLTTYVAGIPELVQHGKNGLLFEAGSVEALADAIESILTASSASLMQMGESARQQVLLRHDIDIEATKLAKLFRGNII
ncbi:glycosyltransferase [Methylotenera sp.]|uniref:glycosyltransferase n=1 Tax=Methylotenera sp. TaxID=2051956 RepID=UPI002727513B|nr:glycosyltransferase [Methylotenera sp.]MDO9127837.1 glycosyltransferase [Parvibaculum sp.]MDP2231518.1 glycosyltransferase [Methylotenera sp.]